MILNNLEKTGILPAFLKSGDQVGIVAPGGKVDKVALEKGCSVIKSYGFEPVLSRYIFEESGYLAGSDEVRASSLMSMFLDSDIKAVICARGGYGSMRIASMLDYDKIAENPKFFTGFSDISILLAEIWKKSRLITYHSPMISTLAFSDMDSADFFFSVLKGEWNHEYQACNINRSRDYEVVEGISVCGNMTVFCHTAGTSFQPDWKNCVVFLEDVNEPLYRLDRMLLQMRLAGMFEGVRAVVLGEFKGCGDFSSVIDLFTRELNFSGIPVFIWPEIGHGCRNLVVPFGLNVMVDSGSGVIRWL